MTTHPASTPHNQPSGFVTHVVVAAMLSVASQCRTLDTVVANPGTEFDLAIGQTAALEGTDYRITFNRVTEDSRCPVDVTCVWAGDAKIELVISRSGTPDDTRVVSLAPPNSEVAVGDLRIRFVSLAPAPRQSQQPASRAYVARLLALSP